MLRLQPATVIRHPDEGLSWLTGYAIERGADDDGDDKKPKAGKGIPFVASTPVPDRMGDVVRGPWQLGAFKANPVLVGFHRYDQPAVGNVAGIKMRDGALVGRAMFAGTALGQELAGLYEAGVMRAFSVGFIPREIVRRSELDEEDPDYAKAGYRFSKLDLLEISAVSVPANPEALAEPRAAKTFGVQDAAATGLTRAALLDLLRTDAELRALLAGCLAPAPRVAPRAPEPPPCDGISTLLGFSSGGASA